MGAILDEVVGPDMVRTFRPQSDARAIIEPEPASLRLLLRNLQPLTSPDPFDTFDVHHPACAVQHHRDAAIPVAAILDSARNDVYDQGRLSIRSIRNLALLGTILNENPERPSVGNTTLGTA